MSSVQPGMFGSGYGKQNDSIHSGKYSAYKEELPYLIDHVSILPSKLKHMKELEKLKKHDKKVESMKKKDPSDTKESYGEELQNSESSDKHRSFLQNALKSIESQL